MPLLDNLLEQDNAGLLGMALMSGGNPERLKKLMAIQMMNDDQTDQTFNAPQYNTEIPKLAPQSPQYASQWNLQGLNPRMQAAIPLIMQDLQAKGWQPSISSGLRTREEQAEKVRQGYSKTMNSKHLFGKAVDIIDRRYGWDGPASDTNYQFWRDLGEAAKRRGLQWGGDWKNFKDVAHVQMALNQIPSQVPSQTTPIGEINPPQIPREVYEEIVRQLDKGRSYGNNLRQNPGLLNQSYYV